MLLPWFTARITTPTGSLFSRPLLRPLVRGIDELDANCWQRLGEEECRLRASPSIGTSRSLRTHTRLDLYVWFNVAYWRFRSLSPRSHWNATHITCCAELGSANWALRLLESFGSCRTSGSLASGYSCRSGSSAWRESSAASDSQRAFRSSGYCTLRSYLLMESASRVGVPTDSQLGGSRFRGIRTDPATLQDGRRVSRTGKERTIWWTEE
jgi:hypothetical protein